MTVALPPGATIRRLRENNLTWVGQGVKRVCNRYTGYRCRYALIYHGTLINTMFLSPLRRIKAFRSSARWLCRG
jgi:hypothetical protein